MSLLCAWGCSPKAPPPPVVTAPHEIRVGILPNEKSRDLDLFSGDLSRRTGLAVHIVVPRDYSELVEGLKAGSVDFAFLAPMTFIESEATAGTKVLLKKVYGDADFYHSAIVVLKNSPFKKVSDLKGKRFAFVDPKSTSGYLYPEFMLRRAGLDPSALKTAFYGTHENALRAVATGKADAAGVWSMGQGKGAWTDKGVTDLAKPGFRVLSESDPIPNDAFVVREKLYAESPLMVFKVMEALIGMGEDGAADPKNNVLKRVFDVDRMATATSRHYDSVRELQRGVKP